MIRDRRAQDLDHLCAVLRAMGHPSAVFTDAGLRSWLEEDAADLAWVFDMAPVSVTPTVNVVGHVQVTTLADSSMSRALADHLGSPAGDVSVIGKLFVRPEAHPYGVSRYLVNESVRHLSAAGKVPVLDRLGSRFPSDDFCRRLGFAETPGCLERGRYLAQVG